MEPLATVIILTYNHQKYIAQAIESVLAQKTNYPFNVVIGDDFSTDETREIIDAFYKKHPQLITLSFPTKNEGALTNEKTCVEAAKGKYIAFLEGDDYWTDTLKLQKQINYLESNPECGLVHGDVNHYDEATGLFEKSINNTNNSQLIADYSFESLLISKKHSIKTMTACFRKEIISTHFDYDIAIQQQWKLTDLPLWLEIAKHSKIHYVDEVFATYRLLKESASRTLDLKKRHQFHVSVFKIRLHYWEKYSGDVNIKNKLELAHAKTNLIDAYALHDLEIAKLAKHKIIALAQQLTFKEKIMYLSLCYRVSKIIQYFNKLVK